MIFSRHGLAVLAIAGLALTGQSALAQTRCVTYSCGNAPISHGINPAGPYQARPPVAPSYTPPSAVGRAAADMDEEGSAWQSANAAGAREGTGHAAPARATPRRSTTTRRSHVRRSSGQHPTAQRTTRRSHAASQRRASSSRHVARRAPVRQVTHRPASQAVAPSVNYNPIIDRASAYQAQSVGASTHVGQWAGRGDSWHSGTVTTWIAPSQWSWTQAPVAGGRPGQLAPQMCGWGSQAGPGLAPQAVFLCHCPSGWRPPGWQHSY